MGYRSGYITCAVLCSIFTGCASSSYTHSKNVPSISSSLNPGDGLPESKPGMKDSLRDKVKSFSNFMDKDLKNAEDRVNSELNDNVSAYVPGRPRIGKVGLKGEKRYGVQWDLRW